MAVGINDRSAHLGTAPLMLTDDTSRSTCNRALMLTSLDVKEQQAMTSIASIFATRPESWGYRGDPFLWDALGWQLSTRIAQNNPSSVVPINHEALLTDTFRSLIDDGDRQGDGLALSWLPSEGMSGGVIHLATWNDQLLPEISRRIRAIKETAPYAMEYHPAEHRFRFAAWAASTAARSSRRVCTFPVSAGAQLLLMSDLKWLSLGSHWLPRSRDSFDQAHQRWCEEILRLGKSEISKSFTYGISAKLVNCYLKALFLQTMVGLPFDPYTERNGTGWDASTRFLHPPIDRVLMEEAARRSDNAMKRRWKQLIGIGWSNFSRVDYVDALRLCREMVGDDVVQIEACWTGFQ